jgi:hypothetical protein
MIHSSTRLTLLLRVWQCVFAGGVVLSAGEDRRLCVWAADGHLVKRFAMRLMFGCVVISLDMKCSCLGRHFVQFHAIPALLWLCSHSSRERGHNGRNIRALAASPSQTHGVTGM